MKRNVEFCEACGDRPASHRSTQSDSNVYCTPCMARLVAQDEGIVHNAVQFLGYALSTINHYVRDGAEVSRIVEQVLRDVLDDRNEVGDLSFADVPAHRVVPQFEQLDQAGVPA
jgi:hypothetical protein